MSAYETVEVFDGTKKELEDAVEKVKAIGELTDIPCLLDSLVYFLPQVLKEDFGI